MFEPDDIQYYVAISYVDRYMEGPERKEAFEELALMRARRGKFMAQYLENGLLAI